MPANIDSRYAKHIQAQKEACKKANYPHFAPHSGKCFSCLKNIYSKMTVAQAYNPITGCPHCGRTFCG